MLNIKHLSFLRKTVLFGLMGLILIAIFSCGVFQTSGHHGGTDVIECNTVASVIEGVSTRDFSLYMALFAIVASLSLALIGQTYHKTIIPTLSLMGVGRFLEHPRLFLDSMREAFRRGLIHPQVYNNTFN